MSMPNADSVRPVHEPGKYLEGCWIDGHCGTPNDREQVTWRAASPEALAALVAEDPEWPYCDMCGEDRVAVMGVECGYCFDCAERYTLPAQSDSSGADS